MILTNEWCPEQPFSGQNTQQLSLMVIVQKIDYFIQLRYGVKHKKVLQKGCSSLDKITEANWGRAPFEQKTKAVRKITYPIRD